MNHTTELQQISEQAIRFMRGKYALDEVACKKTLGLKPVIEARNISAGDVTWAILPFVEDQYGN